MAFFGRRGDDLYFKDVPEGRAFYPYGRMGRGRVVDEATERKIRSALRIWFVLVAVVIFGQRELLRFYGLSKGLEIGGIFDVLLIGAYFPAMNHLTAGCVWTAERMNVADVQGVQAARYSAWRIVYLMLGSLVLASCSGLLFLGSLAQPDMMTAIGGFGLLFFGFCLLYLVKVARLKWRMKRRPERPGTDSAVR